MSPARWLRGVLLAGMALASTAAPAQNRPAGSNPRYEQGDWISYGVTRFVTSIAVGREFVYFGTTGGILRYNVFTRRWDYPLTTSNGLAANSITAVAFDENTGFLWAATTRGVSYYHPTAQRWTNIYKDEIGIPRYDEVTSIGVGRERVFFETRSGLMFAAPSTGGVVSELRGNAIRFGGIKWFGERVSRGIRLPLFYLEDGYFFNPDGFIEDFRLRRAPISAAVKDEWGNMWLGTWGFGALHGELRSERLQMLPFGLYSRHVQALAMDGDGLWIGGLNTEVDRAGLTYWDQVRHRWQYFESRFIDRLLSDEINRLVVAGDTLYCATRFGISVYDRGRNRWSQITISDGLLRENVYDVLPEGNFLWVATDGGINLVNLKSVGSDSAAVVEVAAEDLHTTRVFDLERTERYLWAATEYGLYRYDVEAQAGSWVGGPDGPRGETVTCLSRWGDELWVGTVHSIYAYDLSKRRWLGAPKKNVFLTAPVRSIQAGKKAVWAGTDEGVMKYDRRNREWRRFTVEDGLIANRVNAILLDGDYVWFGTPEGVTVFYWNSPRRID